MPRPSKADLARLAPPGGGSGGPSPWITVAEAARYLGVGVDAIYEACAKKGLKHFKVGHSTIRLKQAWVDAWAERRAIGHAEPTS
jgi:excisionase family DNA binding protein